jgi:hypothetical protein
MQPTPDAIEALERKLGRKLTPSDLGQLVDGIWRDIKTKGKKKRERPAAKKRSKK